MSARDALNHLRKGLAGRRIAYLAPDIGRTLGLQTLLGDLVTVCFDDMGVSSGENHPILVVPEDQADPVRGSASLLDNPAVPPFLRSHGVTDVVAFKVNARLIHRATELGLRVLASPPAVAQRFENKVHFSEILHHLGIETPATEVFPLGLSSFDPDGTHLAAPWIVQAARGHSGQTTWVVGDPAQWNELRSHVGTLPGRVAEWVPGPTWTVNATVVDADRIAVGPGFRQVTGIQELTPFPLGACGNCWAQPPPFESRLHTLARSVGKALAAANFRGAFGIDVVVADPDRLVVIECNPRVTSGQAMESMLLQAAGSASPLLWHLVAFAGEVPSDLGLDPSAAIRGSQLVFYNPEPADVMLAVSPRSGTYEVTPTQLVWRSTNINPAYLPPNSVVVLARSAGRRVPKGSEIVRVQALDVWLDDDGQLTVSARKIVEWLHRRVVLNLV